MLPQPPLDRTMNCRRADSRKRAKQRKQTRPNEGWKCRGLRPTSFQTHILENATVAVERQDRVVVLRDNEIDCVVAEDVPRDGKEGLCPLARCAAVLLKDDVSGWNKHGHNGIPGRKGERKKCTLEVTFEPGPARARANSGAETGDPGDGGFQFAAVYNKMRAKRRCRKGTHSKKGRPLQQQ